MPLLELRSLFPFLLLALGLSLLAGCTGRAEQVQRDGGSVSGLQVNTHAIGDRATAQVIETYKAVMDLGIGTGRQHRIEHASLLQSEDIETMAKYDIIASV